VKQYIILNTSRKYVNYKEDKNKVLMNKPYNIQNTNICKSIHALLGWYKKNTTFLAVLLWFFVNFARKVSLEIFDKSRPKLMNYYFFCIQLINISCTFTLVQKKTNLFTVLVWFFVQSAQITSFF
jgi:hypothetical protein